MNRANFHTKLLQITKNVYFQPPVNITLEYPCIVYKLYDKYVLYADGKPYRKMDVYELTFISRDPDWMGPDKAFDLFGHVSYENEIISDNLYHQILHIYNT